MKKKGKTKERKPATWGQYAVVFSVIVLINVIFVISYLKNNLWGILGGLILDVACGIWFWRKR